MSFSLSLSQYLPVLTVDLAMYETQSLSRLLQWKLNFKNSPYFVLVKITHWNSNNTLWFLTKRTFNLPLIILSRGQKQQITTHFMVSWYSVKPYLSSEDVDKHWTPFKSLVVKVTDSKSAIHPKCNNGKCNILWGSWLSHINFFNYRCFQKCHSKPSVGVELM